MIGCCRELVGSYETKGAKRYVAMFRQIPVRPKWRHAQRSRNYPGWKHFGTATTVKANTLILHSRADETVPFSDSEELVRNSSLPGSALIEVGSDHRLADDDPLWAMLEACEQMARQ